ncbi:MAG TPA: glucokinase [Vicinamibacterales bacterium]|nr:glucokinase [Vicinamibacterales bacterium]
MILAGDIGGTKTLLGLFDPDGERPRPIHTFSYSTLAHTDLTEIVAAFLNEERVSGAAVSGACFGVAGPVIDEAAELTNVPWRVDARKVASAFRLGRVSLLNDLEAMAYAVPVLTDSEVLVLQKGDADLSPRGGNIALIAAGTGLGEALLHDVGGRFVPSPSEGGHADFSARTEREIGLLRHLTARYGRADVEHVVSGRGLINIHRFVHTSPCAAGISLDDPNAGPAISSAALERRCAACVETLDLFVEAYGAEAGNLALRGVTTGGVFVGGGIAPKILPAMTSGAFMRAFRAKPPLEPMLRAMPVKIILNAESGLLGAAVFCSRT